MICKCGADMDGVESNTFWCPVCGRLSFEGIPAFGVLWREPTDLLFRRSSETVVDSPDEE